MLRRKRLALGVSIQINDRYNSYVSLRPALLFLSVLPIDQSFPGIAAGIVMMAESPGKMYAIATVMTLLAMTAIGLRFYARRIKQTKLMWDDYMILPAMVRQLCLHLPLDTQRY